MYQSDSDSGSLHNSTDEEDGQGKVLDKAKEKAIEKLVNSKNNTDK